MTRPVVEVAVGIVHDSQGRVLFGQRPAGKPYAGWWEFPGGKLERGESVAQALARELHEELGIRVARSCPWLVREFEYEHAHVRLYFRRVFEWGGQVQSRESQAFDWQLPDRITLQPLLPASLPVIRMLCLPRQLWVCEAQQLLHEVREGLLPPPEQLRGSALVIRAHAEALIVQSWPIWARVRALSGVPLLLWPEESGLDVAALAHQLHAKGINPDGWIVTPAALAGMRADWPTAWLGTVDLEVSASARALAPGSEPAADFAMFAPLISDARGEPAGGAVPLYEQAVSNPPQSPGRATDESTAAQDEAMLIKAWQGGFHGIARRWR